MKTYTTFLVLILMLVNTLTVSGQRKRIVPDLTTVKDSNIWSTHNREAIFKSKAEGVHMDVKAGDGIVWLKDFKFGNGIIEADVKGKNIPGQSFVGIAFHGIDEQTYDAIYFRPFNFRNPDRKNHSVQYISHPKKTWNFLRDNFPGKYENAVNPVPDPVDDWFHVAIKINYPTVSVFIDHQPTHSLQLELINTRKEGFVGFWVGNNSDGNFKNLKISRK